jgi:dTDP-4-dehydrorhamnose reductase
VILVTGANGVVGTAFREQAKLFDEPLDFTDIDELDVRNPSVVMERVANGNYSHVIHLAAETDVDLCEQSPDHAYLTNAVGTYHVALACQKYRVVMVYVSTAGVFGGDGKLGPFTEFDPPCPANIYGVSKLKGEESIEKLLRHYYIVRAGWMMGGGQLDKKFVGKMLRLMKTEKTVFAVHDKIGSPTYAPDLVVGIRQLIQTGYYGLYHIVNQGIGSRYEIACKVAELLGKGTEVIPVSSERFPLPAPRANSEALRNYRQDLMGFKWMRPWPDALAEYVWTWRNAIG